VTMNAMEWRLELFCGSNTPGVTDWLVGDQQKEEALVKHQGDKEWSRRKGSPRG